MDDGARRRWTGGHPEASLFRTPFFAELQTCNDRLPANPARAHEARGLEYEAEQICKEMGATSTHCFVMLHRARMRPRAGFEQQWCAGQPGN